MGGGGGEGDVQPPVTEHDRINFSMRVRLAREEAKDEELAKKGRRNPGGVSVALSPMEEAISIADPP